MQKLGKMTFTKGCQICNQSPKNYQTERRKVPERPIENSNVNSSNHQARKNDKEDQKGKKGRKKCISRGGQLILPLQIGN
jgi:hypothetical protein